MNPPKMQGAYRSGGGEKIRLCDPRFVSSVDTTVVKYGVGTALLQNSMQ